MSYRQSKYSIYTTTVDKWTEILALAQRWVFKEVEQLCIRELQKLSIPPIEKIQIYQAFHIDRSLLAESFAELTLRPEPLSLEEGNKLGIETALRIAQARELSRGTNSRTRASVVRLNDAELRSVIQNAFGLGEEAFFDFAVDDSFRFMRTLQGTLLTYFVIRRRVRHQQPPHLIPPQARKHKRESEIKEIVATGSGLCQEVCPDCVSSIASEDNSHSQYLGRVFCRCHACCTPVILRFLYHISLIVEP
jgi:hypothetical protein